MPFMSRPYIRLTAGGMHNCSLPSAPSSPKLGEVDAMHLASLGSSPDQGSIIVQRPVCPRYAASETDSDFSDDPFQDSISSNASISSASSVNGDDEQELTQGLIDLSLSHDGIPSLECKKGYEETLPPVSAAPMKKMPEKTPQASPDTDRISMLLDMLLNKQHYHSDIAKAATNETLLCFAYERGKPSMTPLDIPLWQAQASLIMHGHDHGRQTGSSHRSGGNNGDRPPPIYPAHVTPPSEWGTRNQQGNGNEDGFEENGWGRESRTARTKKRIACPAAKGDPFYNRACLGVSFPNLAKTRQHLSCAAHFAVDKTPLLPDPIRDPNGWDEIMAYIYPDKETPSSDEDFHATMNLIERKGMGPGKPDFRSTLIRMVKYIMADQNYGMEVVRELEAIDPSHQADYSVPPPFSPPSDLNNYQLGLDTSGLSTFSQQTGLHYNSPINSEPSKGIFTPVSMGSLNTPTSGSGGSPLAMLSGYGPGITSAGTLGPRQYPTLASQPTIMDPNQGSLTAPDLHNQADNEMQMNPVGGPPPDRQPQIYVRLPNTHYSMMFPFNSDLTLFESWIQTGIHNFSFETYSVRAAVVSVGTFNVVSIPNLCEVYANLRANFPGEDLFLEVSSKLRY